MIRTGFLATSFSERLFKCTLAGILSLEFAEVFDQLTHADVLRYYRRRYFRTMCFWWWWEMSNRIGSDPRRKNFLDSPNAGRWSRSSCRKNLLSWAGARPRKDFAGDLAYFNLGWHVPGVSHDDMAAVDAASVILGRRS